MPFVYFLPHFIQLHPYCRIQSSFASCQAYIEEQKRREAQEKKKNEIEAISRWYQLLSSIVTRQRIKNRYGEGSSLLSTGKPTTYNNSTVHVTSGQDDKNGLDSQEAIRSDEDRSYAPLSADMEEDHKHVFVTEDRCFDDENFVPTKRCHCGLIVQAEDL